MSCTKICGKKNRECEFLNKETNCGLRKRFCHYQLKKGDNVKDTQGNSFEVAFIDGLGRTMLDENAGMFSKMFELDEFPVCLANAH